MNVYKKVILISIGAIAVLIVGVVLGVLIVEGDVFEDIADAFSSNKTETIRQTANKKMNTQTAPKANSKGSKFNLFGPKVNITKNKVKNIAYETYNNGLFSMKIPKGWKVGVGVSDYIHYTFMAYDPQNPDYKIFFNMKTEGYMKTQQMRAFYGKYYPNTPMAKLPAINPQTTEAFYKIFTQAYNLEQSKLPFKVPVIKNFTPVQNLGKNITGGTILRATYLNEQGKKNEGVFTATIKEFAMPPVVLLIVYNTIYFSVPDGELVDWMPVLNSCVASIKFSDQFINGYYQQEGQVVKNAQALQAICNKTSDIITSGWNARQKTYDILSQKRSDATMGYERVQDTDTGEIYKATVGFTDHDWHGKYEPITDDMYNLPTAGYIEKQ